MVYNITLLIGIGLLVASILMAAAMPFIIIGGGYHLANMFLTKFNTPSTVRNFI